MYRRSRGVIAVIFLSAASLAALLIFPTAEGFQPQLTVRSVQQHSKIIGISCSKPEDTKFHKSRQDDSEDNATGVMESLDVVLERARRRKPSWVLRGIAFLNSPMGVSWFSKLDSVLVILASSIGSYGFGAGYILGKWMTNPENQMRLRNLAGDSVPIQPWQLTLLFQYLPVLLAIVMDQALNVSL